MTAITFTGPSPLSRTRPAPSRGGQARPAPSRPAPRAQRARSMAAVRRPLRLTRRGRLLLTGLIAAVAIVASLFAGGIGLASSDARPVPVRYITVTPGATLWGIAGEVAPEVDRRDTVARILELNALPSSSVQAGQRIAVPVS